MNWKVITDSKSELNASIKDDSDFKSTIKWIIINGCGKKKGEKVVKDVDGNSYCVDSFTNGVLINIYPTSITNGVAGGWVADKLIFPDNTEVLITTKVEFINALISKGLFIQPTQIIKEPTHKSSLPPGSTPGLILDLISACHIYLDRGLSLDNVPKESPNYKALVELKMIASDTFKDDEEFYSFLDDIREFRKIIPYQNKLMTELKEQLAIDYPAISTFMESRNYFTI